MPPAGTNVGRIREHNEDAYLVEAPLFAVADGMGGHLAGEVASALAIETLRDAFDSGSIHGGADLVRVFHDANDRIILDGRRHAGRHGMGTTCVAAWVDGSEAVIAHLGDSRAYLLRAGRLQRVTDDHSLVATLVREGMLSEEDAERDPRRHIITRALGTEGSPTPDLIDLHLKGGERLLLCTDGLSGCVPATEIATLLAGGDPAQAADRLVARTLELGAPDNVTVIVIEAPIEAPAEAPVSGP